MNIYQKLQEARVKLQSQAINKSGNNKFAGYAYMELGDFLPAINSIMKETGLCSFIQFNSDLAVLTLVNAENPEERMEFTSPMATAQLKGCHDVQNLGAVQTYLRRYLYINAFEIVEHDALDAVTGSDLKDDTSGQVKKGTNTLPKEKVDAIKALSSKKGITEKYICTQKKVNSFAELKLQDWNAAMAWLEKKEDKEVK